MRSPKQRSVNNKFIPKTWHSAVIKVKSEALALNSKLINECMVKHITFTGGGSLIVYLYIVNNIFKNKPGIESTCILFKYYCIYEVPELLLSPRSWGEWKGRDRSPRGLLPIDLTDQCSPMKVN